MPSLNEILNSLTSSDETEKVASAKQDVQVNSEESIITKVASQLSEAEIASLEGYVESHEIEKTASEADAYGRFMARGFHDEWMKLAMDTDGAPNSMMSTTHSIGTPALEHGSGGKAMAEGGSVVSELDPSNVLQKIKSSIESAQEPASPTAKEDAMHIVKKIIDTAKEVKQHPAEVPHNG
jgi:hypothetical protein